MTNLWIADFSAAVGAAYRAAKSGAMRQKVVSSKEEKERRLAICKECEFFQASPLKCRKCGCFLQLKTRLETEHCPIGKW
jgi:hypothetical protein